MGTVDNGEREEEGRSVEKAELKLELEWKVELSLVALSLNNVKNRVFLWLDVEKSEVFARTSEVVQPANFQ